MYHVGNKCGRGLHVKLFENVSSIRTYMILPSPPLTSHQMNLYTFYIYIYVFLVCTRDFIIIARHFSFSLVHRPTSGPRPLNTYTLYQAALSTLLFSAGQIIPATAVAATSALDALAAVTARTPPLLYSISNVYYLYSCTEEVASSRTYLEPPRRIKARPTELRLKNDIFHSLFLSFSLYGLYTYVVYVRILSDDACIYIYMGW